MKKAIYLMFGLCLLFFASGVKAESVINSNTGEDSENKVEINVENSFSVENEDETIVDNHSQMELKTGENEAEENTGNGSVISGDITVNEKISNKIENSTHVVFVSPTPSPTVVPISTLTIEGGVGGFPETLATIEGGVGGAPEELPGAGSQMGLLSLLASFAGAMVYAIFRYKKLA